MQKILNEPLAFVDEMLEGIMLAHPVCVVNVPIPRMGGGYTPAGVC